MELIVLPCTHAFCHDCITQWKTQSLTCQFTQRVRASRLVAGRC
jgi:hypothetical protein